MKKKTVWGILLAIAIIAVAGTYMYRHRFDKYEQSQEERTAGITLDKKLQRRSLEWIREQSLSPDCIESLATHDTDVEPHVIEL